MGSKASDWGLEWCESGLFNSGLAGAGLKALRGGSWVVLSGVISPRIAGSKYFYPTYNPPTYNILQLPKTLNPKA